MPVSPGRPRADDERRPPPEGVGRLGSGPSPTPAARRSHWRAVRAWTLCLLLAWSLVTFGIAWHARALDFRFFGWPFSFWVAAQGALLVYLGLVALYAWAARRLDEAHDLDERD